MVQWGIFDITIIILIKVLYIFVIICFECGLTVKHHSIYQIFPIEHCELRTYDKLKRSNLQRFKIFCNFSSFFFVNFYSLYEYIIWVCILAVNWKSGRLQIGGAHHFESAIYIFYCTQLWHCKPCKQIKVVKYWGKNFLFRFFFSCWNIPLSFLFLPFWVNGAQLHGNANHCFVNVVKKRSHIFKTNTHTQTYILYIYVCICSRHYEYLYTYEGKAKNYICTDNLIQLKEKREKIIIHCRLFRV